MKRTPQRIIDLNVVPNYLSAKYPKAHSRLRVALKGRTNDGKELLRFFETRKQAVQYISLLSKRNLIIEN